jgi:4-hydroxy-3-polyprenylbenzoate decarboxylase
MSRVLLCITGASGSIYGVRLLEVLERNHHVDLIVSPAGELVLKEEMGLGVEEIVRGKRVSLHNCKDLTSAVASGSRLVEYKGVIVAPCSTSTMGNLANGINENLIHRACEVALKERVPLLLLVREMPYSDIHLENMLRLSRAGAIIMPASPGFYHKPKDMGELVDFVVGKILDSLRISHNLYKRWRA